MLETVVENVRVHMETPFRSLPAAKAVSAHDERNFRKHAGQKRRLIADFLRLRAAACSGRHDEQVLLAAAAVPSRENAGFPPPAQQDVGDAGNQGRLPGSTHGEIANTHHWPRQAPGFEPAMFVARLAQGDAEPESDRKWQ